MKFQIIFIEDRDDTVDFCTAYQSELSSALNLTTDIKDTVSINAENFVSLFGKWGTVILDEAQKKEMDLRNVVAMRSSVLALLKKCRKEFSVRNTLQILFSAFSTEKDEIQKDEIQNSVENPHYSINVINASVSPNVLLKMSQKQIKKKMTGLKLLFTGPSGTGKTAFAHYISEKLGIGLITAKASEILARHVGGSEENTCELFKRAKEEGKILLIDEIDAFLGRRDGRDPNLRVTASLVNQFLQEIEDFNGVFIGTTNVINTIDPAFIRRFTKIVDFKYLTEDGIRSLLGLYFPDYVFSESQIKELVSQETLGSGDFGSVYSDVQFLDEGEITPDYIVQSLSELGMIREHKKSRIIGFCAN